MGGCIHGSEAKIDRPNRVTAENLKGQEAVVGTRQPGRSAIMSTIPCIGSDWQ